MARGRVGSGEATLNLSPGPLVGNEFIVTGSKCVTKQEIAETIEMVRQGRIKSIISRKFSLEEVPEVHELLDAREIFGRAVLVM